MTAQPPPWPPPGRWIPNDRPKGAEGQTVLNIMPEPDLLNCLARAAATFVRRRRITSMDLDELVNEGWLRVRRESHKFDPARGNAHAFVFSRASMAMNDHLRWLKGTRKTRTGTTWWYTPCVTAFTYPVMDHEHEAGLCKVRVTDLRPARRKP